MTDASWTRAAVIVATLVSVDHLGRVSRLGLQLSEQIASPFVQRRRAGQRSCARAAVNHLTQDGDLGCRAELQSAEPRTDREW